MFYDKYRELCSKNNKTPSEVAEELGISKTSVTRWKRGAVPNSKTLSDIANYFNVSMDSLYDEAESFDASTDCVLKESDDTYIIDKIFDLMEANNITPAQLSREVSITNGIITQWKQGKQKPSIKNLIKIADYFKVTVDSLLSRSEDFDIYKIRIKPLFENSNKTNIDLEKEIGLPEKSIDRWNRGDNNSYIKYISQIANYFNVTTDYILQGKETSISPVEMDSYMMSLYNIANKLNEQDKNTLLEMACYLEYKERMD